MRPRVVDEGTAGEGTAGQGADRAVPETVTIRFCAVDDHEVVRGGLERMASRTADLVYCGGAADPAGARDLVAAERPDVVMLDLMLEDDPCWDLCRLLRAASPSSRVLIFSGYGNPALLQRAVDVGASGYLLKQASTRDIPAALRQVVTQGGYVDPSLSAALMASPPARTETFTDQELEIVRLVAEGLSNHEIAERVHLSYHTVKFHLSGMLRRCDARNRAELVKIVTELRLLA